MLITQLIICMTFYENKNFFYEVLFLLLQLSDVRGLLSQTGQPQLYMVQSLRAAQEETRDLRERVRSLEREIE